MSFVNDSVQAAIDRHNAKQPVDAKQPVEGALGPAAPIAPTRARRDNDVWRAIRRLTEQNIRKKAARANGVASTRSEIEATVAGEYAVIPAIYGRQRVGAKVATVTTLGSDLLILAVWGQGGRAGIQEIEDVRLAQQSFTEIEDDIEVPRDLPVSFGTFERYDYLGDPTNPDDAIVDPLMKSAISGYDDRLLATVNGVNCGIAYSVVRIPIHAEVNGFPQMVATVKGLKVYDPRATGQVETDPSTWAYSANPALCRADFETSVIYGRGSTIDWTSVGDVADDQDEDVGGKVRRSLGLVINSRVSTRQMAEALDNYASCFSVDDSGVTYLVSDKPATAARAVTAADMVKGSFRLARRNMLEIPTVMRVRYTDTTAEPWREGYAVAYAPGVEAGTRPRRDSEVFLPGITDVAEAYRAAVHWLNSAVASDLDVSFDTHDEALADLVGDLITVSHPIGISKDFRVMAVNLIRQGRWRLTLSEYDPAMYSDAIVTAPVYTDTNLPNPSDVGAVTNLVAVEELYVSNNQQVHSRVRVTFDRVNSSFVTSYLVEVKGPSVLLRQNVAHGVDSQITVSTAAVDQAVGSDQDGIEFTATVRALTSVGVGPAATYTLTVLGRLLNPTNVTNVRGSDMGAFVYLSWDQAFDIDLTGYQVRRGSVSDTWSTAGISVKSTRSNDKVDVGLPAGTYRYFVRAHDSRYTLADDWDYSVGFSPIAGTVDVVVDDDETGATLVNDDDGSSVTHSNTRTHIIDGEGVSLTLATGQTWMDRFGTAASPPASRAWSANTNKAWILDHPTGLTPTMTSAIWDTGSDRAGVWQVDMLVDSIDEGSPAADWEYDIELATAAGYPTFAGGATNTRQHYSATAYRYMRFKLRDTSTSAVAAMQARFPARMAFRL